MSPTPTYEPPAQRSGLWTALVAGAIIALVGANVYLYVQINNLRTDMAKATETLKTEIASVRDSSSVTTAAQMRHIEGLKEELESARTQIRTTSSQAKTEAIARAEQLSRQIEAEQAKVQQQVSKEISGVRQTAETATAKIADVSTDVGSVKNNLATTDATLQKTIADLKSARGDLGVQSGLIATNSNELAALKRLGERNYFEFTIHREKKPTRVGDVSITLKKVDVKKNRFNIDVLADDKLTPKENKTVNEPIQFYTSKARQPYELVVNKVDKNTIVGYLATPKDQASR
ncbi:MAG: hypothetical protein LAQ30_04720 [Acidobacteriia bacterium]|nr:hypothetical protein [Terriglobia bacterium]